MSEAKGAPPAVRARQALSLGNYKESAALYAEALALEPRKAALYHEVGMLSCICGDFDGALGLFREALGCDVFFAPALRGTAAILCWKGRPQEALSYVEKLRAQEGDDPDLKRLLDRIQRALGRKPGGEGSDGEKQRSIPREEGGEPESWMVGRPGNPGNASCDEWLELGMRLRQSGSLSRACEAFRAAMERDPVEARPYLQLGMTLAVLGRSAEAASCLACAVRLDPENAEIRGRWGAELVRLGETAAGVEILECALRMKPDMPETLRFLGAGLLQIGRQVDAVETLRRAVSLQPDNPALHSQLLSALNYVPVGDRSLRYEDYREYSRRFEEPVLQRFSAEQRGGRPEKFASLQARRIRLGYVSGDFRNHSVAFFVEPLLAHHDSEKFEVFCYMTRPESDAVTERLRGMSAHWRQVASLGHGAFADLVKADGIDVLIDLSSHTAENRLPVFAYKGAPVQVTMIGLMQTTGMRSIDYRITDAFFDPPGEGEAFNSERLWRLSSGPLVFSPPPGAPEPNALPAASGGQFTLACTNDLEKVTPAVCQLWAQILRAIPAARLLYFGRSGNRFAREMAGNGIAADRLWEHARLPLIQFLGMHHRIDLALDPFPYNGLTVTLLSAWMGVPCVTLEGKSPFERAAGSLLRRMDLPDFVATTPEEYVTKVTRLAADVSRLEVVRKSLRSRVREKLCDAAGHVAELEAAFVRMLEAASER
jgi:protein O-GlcNAc transferase